MKYFSIILCGLLLTFVCFTTELPIANNVDNRNEIIQSNDFIVVDNEYITFKILSIEKNPYWETYNINVSVTNKTKDILMVGWDKVLINNISIDPYWGVEVLNERTEDTFITFQQKDLEKNNIIEVKDIKFTLYVNNFNSWEHIFEENYVLCP